MKNTCPLRSLKVTLLICLLSLISAAQGPDSKSISRQPTGQPISSALNDDGSIKRGISGSFDPKGFRMANGPDGSPHFVPETEASSSLSSTVDCNDGWDDRFWTNGANGDVFAIVSDGVGNIYFGGNFTSIGNVPASRIAKWDGSTFSAIGGGIPIGHVNAIAVSGSDVYVGGSFTTAGGEASDIAKWNGSSWLALGSGLTAGEYCAPEYGCVYISEFDCNRGN